MAVQITIRRDTLANWTSKNPVLALAEFCVVTDAASDALKIKIGDGSTAWNSLPYFNPAGGGGSAVWGGIGGDINNQTDLITLVGTKQDTITTGTTSQYFRGDLSLATFPTALSDFSNDVGFITSSSLSPYLTIVDAANTYVALTGDQTISGTKTFSNSIRFATGQAIADANGNNLIGFPATIASAVNWLQVSNSISGNPVRWEAVGSDTNVGITATTKGTGAMLLQVGGTTRVNIGNASITLVVSTTCNASLTANTAIISGGRMMEQGAQNTTPTNGGSTPILTTVSVVNIDPAGVIASHTYTLPASTLNDGTVITLTCGQNGVTALTLNGGDGTTVVGAITTISAGQFAKYRYRSSTATYYRIG